MPKPAAILGQALLYALFAAAIAGFSHYPRYQHLAGNQSLLKLSFSHPGQLKGECRRRGVEELAKLPPNMRNLMDCPRERSPVTVELDLDGNALTRAVIPPSGLSRDGPSTVYARFPVTAGPHQIRVRINDSVRASGFNYTRDERISLRPGQILVVDFNAEKGGIVLQ